MYLGGGGLNYYDMKNTEGKRLNFNIQNTELGEVNIFKMLCQNDIDIKFEHFDVFSQLVPTLKFKRPAGILPLLICPHSPL